MHPHPAAAPAAAGHQYGGNPPFQIVQSTLQVLMQPMPDTGKPIFGSEDIARWVPGIPAGDRVRLINRIRRDMQQMQMQQQMAQQAGTAGGEGEQPQEMAA